VTNTAEEEGGTLAPGESIRLGGRTLLPAFVWVVLLWGGRRKVKLITAFNQLSKTGY